MHHREIKQTAKFSLYKEITHVTSDDCNRESECTATTTVSGTALHPSNCRREIVFLAPKAHYPEHDRRSI